MKRIAIVFIGCLFCIGSTLDAQIRLIGERSIYTHHYLSPVLVNPGATGFAGEQQLLFNYRNAWATFSGSPKTLTFSYDGPIGNRLSIGAQLMRDDYAALETTKGQLAVAYAIDSPINKVSFGLSTEFIQHRLSASAANNDLIEANDALILQGLDGSRYFDASFGAFGMYDNRFIYGVSFPSLISSKISDGTTTGQPERDFGYIVNLGYHFAVDNHDMTIEPSLYAKKLMLVPFHVDLNLKLQFLDEQLTGGLSYTVGADKRFGFLIGARVNTFGFFYSYNVSFHDFQQYNNGSHEFTLKLNLKRSTANDGPSL